MKASVFVIAALGLVLFSSDAVASCKRYVPTPGHPEPDGPGAWGPLQNTVTRDCLVFKGIITRHKEPIALLEDERGQIYKVKRGDFVGENGGRIEHIGADRITLLQLVPDGNGGWVQSPCYIVLGQDNRGI